MPTFTHLACADKLNLDPLLGTELQPFSRAPIVFHETSSRSAQEVIDRIGDADGVLVSFGTPMGEEVLKKCPNLKYIGVCGTSLISIDMVYANERGIIVTNVTDYSDEATAEWIIGRLIALYRGWLGENAGEQTELTGKRLGIVGMGAVAHQLVKRALAMDMQVSYFSRARKPEVEVLGVSYSSLEMLLGEGDIISLHVPRTAGVLETRHFALFKDNAILVNTSLGQIVPIEPLLAWLKKSQGTVIMDGSVDTIYHSKLKDQSRAILSTQLAGITIQARERLTRKVIGNLENYCQSNF